MRPGEHEFAISIETAEEGSWTQSVRRTIQADTDTVLQIRLDPGFTRGLELNWSSRSRGKG